MNEGALTVDWDSDSDTDTVEGWVDSLLKCVGVKLTVRYANVDAKERERHAVQVLSSGLF